MSKTWKSGLCATIGIALLIAARFAVEFGEINVLLGMPLMGSGLAIAGVGFAYFSRSVEDTAAQSKKSHNPGL